MVAGDLVNTASRLQTVAPPGTVLVGEATLRAGVGGDRLRAGGRAGAEGQERAGAGLAAVRWSVACAGGAGREALEAPFVGREEELRLLKDLFHAHGPRASARGWCRSSGQAGIGKSRLGWEFLKYIDGVAEDVYWHHGPVPAYGEGHHASGRWARWSASGPASPKPMTRRPTRARRSQPCVDEWRHRRDRAALDRAARCCTLLGLERGAETGHARSCSRPGATSSSASPTEDPVVLVFEDLHWADSGLLDFIDHLLEWSRASRSTSSPWPGPELLERRPTWGAGKRSFTSSTSSRLPSRRCASCSPVSFPGCPDAAARAHRWNGRRGSPVRGRDGPDAASPRAGWSRRAGYTARPATSPSWRCPSRCRR